MDSSGSSQADPQRQEEIENDESEDHAGSLDIGVVDSSRMLKKKTR